MNNHFVKANSKSKLNTFVKNSGINRKRIDKMNAEKEIYTQRSSRQSDSNENIHTQQYLNNQNQNINKQNQNTHNVQNTHNAQNTQNTQNSQNQNLFHFSSSKKKNAIMLRKLRYPDLN